MNVQRTAARVVLLNPAGETLLFEGRDLDDPTAPRWWFTPGGEVEPGESVEQAAAREVRQETGHVLPGLVGPLARRTFTFANHGVLTDQVEVYFGAQADDSVVSTSAWTDLERRAVTGWRWWSAAGLQKTDEVVYPTGLIDLVAATVRAVRKG